MDEAHSNLSQWVSQYPRQSHLILNTRLTKVFAEAPPPHEPELDKQWKALVHTLESETSTGDEP